MIYKHSCGDKLSALGFGALSLPESADEVFAMTDCAVDSGVNYFDVSGISPEASSLLGKSLARYSRESYRLAASLPAGVRSSAEAEKALRRQLTPFGTDYFDYYLVPDVDGGNINAYTFDDEGAVEYLVKSKHQGAIRHLGFSLRGSIENARQFLDLYGDDTDFCQISLNWLNWERGAKEKLEFLSDRAVPIWVTDATAGGRLCRLSEEYENALTSTRPDEPAGNLAFRFIQSLPTVTVTVHNMQSLEDVKNTAEIMAHHKPLAVWELPKLLQLAREMNS